jgi:predicted MFS family arabinose efflux permease
MVLAAFGLALAPISQIIWSEFSQMTSARASRNDGFHLALLARHLLPTVAWSTALYGMYTYLASGLAGLGYGPGRITGVVFVYGAAAFAGALLGGRITDRVGPAVAIRLSLTGLCVCFMILRLAVQQDIAVGIAFGATSLIAQVFFPAQQSLLLSVFPDRAATALSWNNSALFLGMGLGALIGGQAMMAEGFTAIMPISATVTIAGWAGFLWYQPRPESPRTT